DAGFLLEGTLVEKLIATAKAVAKFGFEAHDYGSFHGERPVYGALLLPSLALLPTVRARRAVLVLGAACLLGVAAWFWTYHEDRYLQALTPWCAACVIAIFACAWRELKLVRPMLALLVALQLLACADIYFLPTHAMAGNAPLLRTIDLINTG